MNNHSKKIIAAGIGSAINLVLFIVKLYVGLSVNSVAIYTDSLNSLADCAVCIAAAVSFCVFKTEATEKYPFGKGRGEDLMNLAVSAVIVVTGCAFLFISLERLMYPVPVWYSSVYAAVIAATAAVKLFLSLFFRKAARSEKNLTLKGISADSALDFFITLCTFISFTLSHRINFSLDGIAGMLISVILVVQGIRMTVSVCRKIIGSRNSGLCEKAKSIMESDSEVTQVASVECHTYGDSKIFNAEIFANCLTTDDMAILTQRLEEKIKDEMQSQLYIKIRR